MRSISILTPQNVMIELEGAGFLLRAVAFGIDIIVRIILVLFFVLALQFMNMGNSAEMVFVYLIILPTMIFYTFLFELFLNGQTPGKMMTGINVRLVNGSAAGPDACLTRWFMRVIAIYVTMGALAGMLINATEKEQRLGDLLAGTIVVKKRKSAGISIEALEELQRSDDYAPQYPQVVNLKEEDVLLIKNTVMRYETYKNKSHKVSIATLVKHLQDLLGIEEEPKDALKFLRTCIKDYIILTR